MGFVKKKTNILIEFTINLQDALVSKSVDNFWDG